MRDEFVRNLTAGVIGAGNIGTAMAALLSQAEVQVTVAARGERLATLARDGVMLDDRGDLIGAPVTAVERITKAVDVLFLCVKAHDLSAAVAANCAAIGPETLVVPMINGLPFWFFYDQPTRPIVPHTDPDGILARALRPEQVLGAVLLMTVRMTPAGHAVSSNTPTLSLAPVAPGADMGRIEALVEALNASNMRADLLPDIRTKVMTKLLANTATNPLSALTGETLSRLGQSAASLPIVYALADEMRGWAKTLGYDLPSNEWLGDLLLDAGDFPTSMLQDARAGRRLELDAICAAPLALAEAAGMHMPVLASLTKLLQAAPKSALPFTGSALLEAIHHLSTLRT